MQELTGKRNSEREPRASAYEGGVILAIICRDYSESGAREMRWNKTER